MFVLASVAASVYDSAYGIQKNFPCKESYECAREKEIKVLGWKSPEIRSDFFRTSGVSKSNTFCASISKPVELLISSKQSMTDAARDRDKAVLALKRINGIDLPMSDQYIHFHTREEAIFVKNIENFKF